jgi:hypothetical protein
MFEITAKMKHFSSLPKICVSHTKIIQTTPNTELNNPNQIYPIWSRTQMPHRGL